MKQNLASDWTAQKERVSGFWLKLIRLLALKFPRGLVKPILHPIVLFYLLISKKQMAASKHYLRQALGRPVRFSDIYKHFLWFATTILDRVYFLTGRQDVFQVSYTHLDEWIESMQRQPAQLYFGAHYGSLDAIRALSTGVHQISIKVVLKVDQNEKIVRLLNELNPTFETNIIPHNGMNTIFEIYDTLESGQSVAILKDRPVGQEKSVIVNFFDDRMQVPIAGFKLAKKLGTPVMIFFGRFEGGNRYHVYSEQLHFEPTATVQEMAQVFMNHVESQCRISPYNWFNFYQYWISNEPQDASGLR